ncbi:MAG: 4-hydroxythreonine-4-phosphate dehydrogenase PdxA, partial [Bacteroidales bacterium]|nr:4-hydroxythreonine-4-phosphate dehydrogenase PdxA [Bacteroidales bacterium]
ENITFNNVRSPEEASPKKASIINCVNDEIRVELGKSTPAAGEASRAALMRAVDDLKHNRIQAIVTAPISKQNIQSDDFRYTGHTEFLQDYFDAEESLMLMAGDLMKVGVVSSHIPISEVPEFISREEISRKIRILIQSLSRDFGIRKPRIAVLGLNPHAGEEGILGEEEKEKIIPAIEKAREDNHLVFGPFPADGFFGSGDFTRFDSILAMYHDQGLIPFKTLLPDEGVNYTAGLPIIRTSPAHGTAFEIAGANQAQFSSFRKALYMACDIYKNRQLSDEISRDPLPENDLTEPGQ